MTGWPFLSPSGLELDLIKRCFAVTDFGTGGKTLDAHGRFETNFPAAPAIP